MIGRHYAVLRGETPSHWPWAIEWATEQWCVISHRQAGLGVCRCCAVLSKSSNESVRSFSAGSTQHGSWHGSSFILAHERGPARALAVGPRAFPQVVAHGDQVRRKGAKVAPVRVGHRRHVVTLPQGGRGEGGQGGPRARAVRPRANTRRFIVHNTIGHLWDRAPW